MEAPVTAHKAGAGASSRPEHPDQMAFEDVVDMERVPGDVTYSEWLAMGKPQILPPSNWDTAEAIVRWKDPEIQIEDLQLPFE